MTSQIDPTKPTSDAPTVASVRANFQHAKDEIEALQNEQPRPSAIAQALADIGTTLADHAQRIAALEGATPPPPPPPPPPSIPGLTVSAVWEGETPSIQGASQNVSVTATTDGSYSQGQIQIGVNAGDAWYVAGSGGDYVTMTPNDAHTASVGVTLQNFELNQSILGKATLTQPPYSENTATIQPAPTAPPPPPQIYCSAPSGQTFTIGDTISVLIGITNTGGSPLFGCDVTMNASNANGPLQINAQASPRTETITDTLYPFGARNVYFDIVIADPPAFDYTVTSAGRNTVDGDQTTITGQTHTGTMTGV